MHYQIQFFFLQQTNGVATVIYEYNAEIIKQFKENIFWSYLKPVSKL